MINRITPRLPASAVKTYLISAPRSTHFRPATCQEVECMAYAHGWITRVDVSTELGGVQANYIRLHSGRSYTVEQQPDSTLVTFHFAPGQTCFAQHSVPLEREPLFVVREGDWRGNPRGIEPRVHAGAGNWVDDFANHQQRLADRLEQG